MLPTIPSDRPLAQERIPMSRRGPRKGPRGYSTRGADAEEALQLLRPWRPALRERGAHPAPSWKIVRIGRRGSGGSLAQWGLSAPRCLPAVAARSIRASGPPPGSLLQHCHNKRWASATQRPPNKDRRAHIGATLERGTRYVYIVPCCLTTWVGRPWRGSRGFMRFQPRE